MLSESDKMILVQKISGRFIKDYIDLFIQEQEENESHLEEEALILMWKLVNEFNPQTKNFIQEFEAEIPVRLYKFKKSVELNPELRKKKK